jgi:hypothetical protein
VKAELGRFEFEVQAYRPVTAILRVLNRYTPEAAESASEDTVKILAQNYSHK